MKTVSWNIHGLSTLKSNPEVKNYINGFDVITLTETWTKGNSDICDFLPDYTCFCVHGKRRSKHGRQPGGIAVFIKTSLLCVIQLLHKTDYGIFLRLSKGASDLLCDIIIACLYIPNEGSTFYTNRIDSNGIFELEELLSDIVIANPDCHLMLCGDFNSRTAEQCDYIESDDISFVQDYYDWYQEDDFNMGRKSRDVNGPINRF